MIGPNSYKEADEFGIIDVTLFVDGYWKKIVLDNFLPCFIDAKNEKKEKNDIKQALEQSLNEAGIKPSKISASSHVISQNRTQNERRVEYVSSRFDPNVIGDECRTTLREIHEFLYNDRSKKDPNFRFSSYAKNVSTTPLHRRVTTTDLAYSKAKHNQLWVQFIEKAYAKIHGCYKSISGGHVAEAFLDLTGAPTAVYNFDHHDFTPRIFWNELMSYRRKRLPMGCGTSSSQEGIIGMHAYSILDVREVKNVGAEFFYDKIAQGTLGNVSGFTDLDGTVRLLRIRNPHGQGEWKGEWSDKSDSWQKLLAHRNIASNSSDSCVDLTKPMSPELERTMRNDGTFWIDYDSFLMGFSNVDVVLAFQGNHAKSFASSFPTKTSNHRCNRAFELRAVERQPGEELSGDDVEVFVMCIQKTRRGAYHGRADRKKSYKACDVGILVGETKNGSTNEDSIELDAVDGRFFGLTRNGHIRLVLNRQQLESRLVVMPISFGHPAATDEALSFVVRFVSDAPLLVRELAKPPRMNIVTQQFCFGRKVVSLGVAGTSRHRGVHGQKNIIFERKLGGSYLFRIVRVDCLAGDGGTVLLYLDVNDANVSLMNQSQVEDAMSFSLELNCRGMSCRTANGIEKHEVISKGKKFEAAWRRFTIDFTLEIKSRLLCVLVQSGQDYQVGSIKCKSHCSKKMVSVETSQKKLQSRHAYDNYDEYGIFASTKTPLRFLSNDNHTYRPVHSEFNTDSQLALALQKSREDFERGMSRKDDNPIISLCDSFGADEASIDDRQLESIIIESIKENSAMTSTTSTDNEDDDLKKAIELSLKSL